MSNKQPLHDQALAMLVQNHQLDAGQAQLGRLDGALEQMLAGQRQNQLQLEHMLAQAQAMASENHIVFEMDADEALLIDSSFYVQVDEVTLVHEPIALLDSVDRGAARDWQDYLDEVTAYAARHELAVAEDPFQHLMSTSQRIALEKRIKDEFSLKGANCDKYDYMIAATCGLIGGLIDVFFVGLPGQGPLTQFSDDMTDKAVQKFAAWNGWTGPNEGKDPTASAIGFLERRYKVNYDHRHGGDVDHLFKMSTKNHHIKSLAHSPDLVGLFFSILDQFTSTAHFVDGGKLISVDTKTFELRGSNLVTKLFAAFANWLGHLFSDMAGSSGATGRGSGIPMPFYSLLQFIDVGEFGQHRQTFATVAVQVFERGYDLRHGMALAIPVLVTELLTRLMWTVKQRFYHQQPWAACIPSAANPELRRMLLIGHGALCLVDGTDAALRSGGDMIQFMLRSNLVAWARFGTLALKELKVWYRQGDLDIEAVDGYLEAEYRRMLAA
ncbi:hypothetical protein [Pseudomonas alkylphenolica]|uniref:Uncharacterized protein n=1 Tax=Pseudomonas sp. Hg7Tf TaxID=3236988 RepID=A0AB39I3E3_9PSED|nr:hypothetical protein [Pseudomonas sp. Hg5Tf]